MIIDMDVVSPGLRERKKAAKRTAIARAATELFAQQGYLKTTTQQVARSADVAEGTLFRYAATKPELLLMVVNEQLRPLVATSPTLAAEAHADEAVLAILDPLIDLAAEQPDNTSPFLREVLFGAHGPQREESLAIIGGLRARIAVVLAPYEANFEGITVDEVSGWLFSTVVSEVLRDVVGMGSTDHRAVLRARVRVMMRGLGVPVAP